MLPVLEKLLILQERDEKLAQLQDELARIPLEEQALETKWQSAAKRLEFLRAGLKQLEVDRKKLDLDANVRREQIGRYKTQQLQTRKNDEFSALNNEISHAEKDIVTIEDRELEVMEQVSEMEKQVSSEQAALQAQESQVVQQRAGFQTRRDRISSEIVRIKELQGEIEQEIEAGLLVRYRRIFHSKKRQAVVPLSHGSCGGCHMKVTAQTGVAARGSEIVTCDNCGRIVYWAD